MGQESVIVYELFHLEYTVLIPETVSDIKRYETFHAFSLRETNVVSPFIPYVSVAGDDRYPGCGLNNFTP